MRFRIQFPNYTLRASSGIISFYAVSRRAVVHVRASDVAQLTTQVRSRQVVIIRRTGIQSSAPSLLKKKFLF